MDSDEDLIRATLGVLVRRMSVYELRLIYAVAVLLREVTGG